MNVHITIDRHIASHYISKILGKPTIIDREPPIVVSYNDTSSKDGTFICPYDYNKADEVLRLYAFANIPVTSDKSICVKFNDTYCEFTISGIEYKTNDAKYFSIEGGDVISGYVHVRAICTCVVDEITFKKIEDAVSYIEDNGYKDNMHYVKLPNKLLNE